MTLSLLDSVRDALLRFDLMRPDRLLLVAVSGGPDSLALCHALGQLRALGGPQLHVAHLDHGLRGAAAQADAEFVAATAAAWGMPATIEHVDLANKLAAASANKLDAARRARYAFLARLAQELPAAAVAVAHQADDQAETVLLHLLHGSGPAGLRGIRELVEWAEWRRYSLQPAAESKIAQKPGPPLVRPLLAVERAAVEHYCSEQGLTPRDDPSNSNQSFVRVRIRSELLPHLAAFNPQIVAALGRTARLCADDYAYIQAQLDGEWPQLTQAAPGRIVFDAARWRQLAAVLQRYALRRACSELSGADQLSYEQVEAGRSAAAQPVGRQHDLGAGLVLRIEHDGVHIARPDATAISDSLPQLATSESVLPVPGTVALGNGWRVCAAATTPAKPPPAGWLAAFDADRLGGPLVVRRRRSGERFYPAGGMGSRRIQDLFVDHKVPQRLRTAWPLLATAAQVAWVAGLRADERVVATPDTRRTVWIWFERDEATREAMHPDIERVLITNDTLLERIGELAGQISRDYAGTENVLLVGVLKGCVMFLVDLARMLEIPVAMDFIAISSYGQSTESSGVVRLLKDLDTDISGQHVLIVEDIIDSGLTLAYLRSQLARRNPASLRICTLLNKPDRRHPAVDVQVDYLGFDIPNEFVVGYGLDYGERYRTLPYIGVLKPAVYNTPIT